MRKPRSSSSSRPPRRVRKRKISPHPTTVSRSNSPSLGRLPKVKKHKVKKHPKKTFRKRLRSLILLLLLAWGIYAIANKPVGYFLRSLEYSFRGLIQVEFFWVHPQTLASEGFQETMDLIDSIDSPGIRALQLAGQRNQQLWCERDSVQSCLQDLKARLPVIYQDLKKAGINPLNDPHALINTLDLYHSGSRTGSRRFPDEYLAAKGRGKNSEDALLQGRIRILSSSNPLHTTVFQQQCPPQQRKADCLAIQQRDRVRAIQAILQPHLKPKFIKPAAGVLSQGFHLYHEGIDIANGIGTPVLAAADGEVIFSGWDEWGLGELVKIRHKDGSISVYGHNRQLLVKVGEWVKQGQTIAKMGNSGNSTGPHLHFEIRLGDRAIDPLPLLPEEN